MTLAQRERQSIVETMRAVGPEAPTLCDGWSVRDLAAHLVIRERRPDAAPGIMLRPFAGHTAAVQGRAAAASWDDLLGRVAAGPPRWSPFRVLDRFVNGTELFIHHEDVRRGEPGWEPRVLRPDDAALLRRNLRLLARPLGRSDARVVLLDAAGETVAAVGRGTEVTLQGGVGELLLFASGRRAARVDLDGDAAAVARVVASRRGM